MLDKRWTSNQGGLRWKQEAEGNRRRPQVVTLQSEVLRELPLDVKAALTADSSVVWPHGRASPFGVGPPRNIRLRDIEDHLLALAQARGLDLVAQPFDPGSADLAGVHVLAVCDGARSPTRDHFSARFGRADPTPYYCHGQPHEDVVLALGVRSGLAPAEGVLLTVAQSRFLLNVHRGEGVLNMRLTRGEATELVMAAPSAAAPSGAAPSSAPGCACLRGRSCTLERLARPDGPATFMCATHRHSFRPPLDRHSLLWPRILEGLRMFDIAEADVTSLGVARVSMVDRPRFTAELTPYGSERDATFGFLLGDAANAIHHWPGRGLNGGLLSAVSLARCLAARWTGARLRHADFARHEGNMHMLQYRHKSRAWAAVVRHHPDGSLHPIADDIRSGFLSRRPRDETAATLMERLVAARDRLAGRLDGLPGDERLHELVARIGDETLSVCAASGPWDSWSAGGEEVDIALMLPPADRPPGIAQQQGACTLPGMPSLVPSLEHSVGL